MANTPKDMLKSGISDFLVEVKRKARINRSWDVGLTAFSIGFALAITVVGLLDESKVWNKKLVTGVLGAGLVAIQSASSSFPVKQRSGGYRLLEAQLINLEYELLYKGYTGKELDDKEAKVILEKLYDLRKEAAKLEGVEGLRKVFELRNEMEEPGKQGSQGSIDSGQP